jgi:hypothetical protein
VTLGSSVTSFGGYAFDSCFALRNLTIPNSVATIGIDAFSSCSSLTNVTFGNSVVSIGNWAFAACSALTNVLNLPTSLQSLGNDAFAGCSGLTSVIIPEGLTNIGSDSFGVCSSLTNIAVDPGNPNYASPGRVLFNKNLSTLIRYPEGLATSNYLIPDSVTVIANYAFNACSGLTNVTFPNHFISLGQDVFYKCYALANVAIPGGVMNFSAYNFASCPNLHQAYFQGNAPTVNGGAGSADSTLFSGDGGGTVYYLPGTTGWGTNYGGWPTAQWYQPQPQILGSGNGLGVQSNQFQFTISWATNTSVVVQASTNLQNWTPVITNTLINGTNAFSDSAFTSYPERFYRVRSQ